MLDRSVKQAFAVKSPVIRSFIAPPSSTLTKQLTFRNHRQKSTYHRVVASNTTNHTGQCIEPSLFVARLSVFNHAEEEHRL